MSGGADLITCKGEEKSLSRQTKNKTKDTKNQPTGLTEKLEGGGKKRSQFHQGKEDLIGVMLFAVVKVREDFDRGGEGGKSGAPHSWGEATSRRETSDQSSRGKGKKA